MLDPVTASTAPPAIAKVAIGIVLKEIWETASKPIRKKLSQWLIPKKISDFNKKIYNVGKVKTIWQTNRAISIKNFYCPSKLIFGEDRKVVNSIDGIKVRGNVIVEGIAGQGKSMFLRHLTITEVAKKRKIPLFLELRNLRDGDSLYDYIKKYFSDLGFSIDDDVFKYLANSDKLILLLDGFDEVSEAKVPSLVNELERLSQTYKKLKIIVSSRPNSEICKSSYFQVLKLAPLTKDDYKAVIKKIGDNKQDSDNIIQAVEKSSSQVKQLITTPLTVTLLVLTYKSSQKIPDTLHLFYDELFFILSTKHDGSKPGYLRERKTNLDKGEFLKAFEGICFYTKSKSKNALSYEEIYECAEKSIEFHRFDEKPDDLLKDIEKVTCLILEEGGCYYFIHKSVQEYHAASFIKRQPDEFLQKFYIKVIAHFHHWFMELTFLKEIDQENYREYFILPLLAYDLGFKSHDEVTHTPKVIIEEYVWDLVKDFKISFNLKDKKVCSYENRHIFSDYLNFLPELSLHSHSTFFGILNQFSEIIFELIEKKGIKTYDNPNENQVNLLYKDLWKINGFKDEIIRHEQDIHNHIHRFFWEVKRLVNEHKQAVSQLDIFSDQVQKH